MSEIARISKITGISPIEGADRIELAFVGGWKSVVKKGTMAVGDKALLFERDPVLPDEDPRFDFLGSKRRIKTMKMRGIVSECLILSLAEFPELMDLDVDTGVMERLGVKKYERELESNYGLGNTTLQAAFPIFIPKTDEPRWQNSKHIFEELYNEKRNLVVTEKLDGTSATFFLDSDNNLKICSRNFSVSTEDDNAYTRVAKTFDIEKVLRQFTSADGCRLVLQGEIVGPKIQNNPLQLKQLSFYVFNLLDWPINGAASYLDTRPNSYNAVYDVLPMFGIKQVPIVEILKSDLHTLGELVTRYTGLKSTINPEVQAEGVVIRPIGGGISKRNFERLSFKIVNPEYLLKNEQ